MMRKKAKKQVRCTRTKRRNEGRRDYGWEETSVRRVKWEVNQKNRAAEDGAPRMELRVDTLVMLFFTEK